jgi:hypothetical protein
VIGAFAEQLGKTLADRWAAIAAPALLFWGAGGAACVSSRAHGWSRLRHWFEGLDGVTQAVTLVAALAVVALSAAVVQWLTRPTARALAGQWPYLSRIQHVMNRRRAARLAAADDRWQSLMQRLSDGKGSPDDARTFAALDARLRRVPADPRLRTPTRLGDLLRSSELWAAAKYGLEPAVCMPRLWLVRPENARSELGTARGRLDWSIAAWIWAAAFAVWVVCAWWAPLLALALALLLYRTAVLAAAETYGDLLEATFDVHRSTLYDSVSWPRPATSAAEPAAGAALTAYLWRGTLPRA